MDSIDKIILDELIQNCRISYRDLGKKVNLSSSSAKKRVDHLENSGLIDHYVVLLNPELINVRSATIIVATDASVQIDTFKETAIAFDGVYMILPLIDGNFYVGIEYSSESDLNSFCNIVKVIPGVQHTEIYDVFPPGFKSDLPATLDFTKHELMVLSQLAVDPRMMDYDIADNLGWPARKSRQILEKLQAEGKVAFGPRVNPSLGRNLAVNLVIKYDPKSTSAADITKWLSDEYSHTYFNSRCVETKSTIFAVFTVEKVVDMEPIVTSVLNFEGVRSCYAITYYTAILGKTLCRVRLEKLLEKEG
ncbi:MAG: Lrp/AsnC family transcriptional regulator, partial [Candidatus Thorarchaeota archaeon]